MNLTGTSWLFLLVITYVCACEVHIVKSIDSKIDKIQTTLISIDKRLTDINKKGA